MGLDRFASTRPVKNHEEDRHFHSRSSWEFILTRPVSPLLPLIAASILTRVYLAYATPVIAWDGILYVSVAKGLIAGDWAKVLWSHPLYPFFMGVAHLWVTDWQWAGQLVSVFFGSISIVPLYYFSRRLFNEKVAIIASILFILHPLHARISAEVVTEATFIFFFLVALLWAWKGLKNEDPLAFFIAGVGSALAFLSRPEGLIILLVTAIWLAFVGPSRRVLAFNLLLLPFLLVASSYIFYLRQATGRWMVTPKKSMAVLLGLAEKPEGASTLFQFLAAERITGFPAALGWLNFFWHGFLNEFIQTFHPLLLILVLAGIFLILKRTGLRKEELFVGSLVVVYLVPLIGLFWTYGYVSHRHFLPIVLIALPWAGYALISWVERGSQKLEDRLGHPVNRRRFLSCVVVGLAIILALKTLKPRRWDKLPTKEAGLWIKAQAEDPLILAEDPRVAFYAGGRHLGIQESLDVRDAGEQKARLWGLVERAWNQAAEFIFLEVELAPDVIEKLNGVPEVGAVKSWKGHGGKDYTLIQLRFTGNTK